MPCSVETPGLAGLLVGVIGLTVWIAPDLWSGLFTQNAAVRAAALVWQTHWSGLAELQPGMAPDPAVWLRIQNLVQADQAQHRMELARAQAASASGWWRSLRWWRGAAAAGALATSVLTTRAPGMNMRAWPSG